MKVLRYDKSGYGKLSTLAYYKQEESETVKIHHIQKLENNTTLLWLEHYGLTSWAIELREGEEFQL